MSGAFIAVLGWFVFGLRCLVGPTRLLVGVAEVGAIACRSVSVLGAQLAVTHG